MKGIFNNFAHILIKISAFISLMFAFSNAYAAQYYMNNTNFFSSLGRIFCGSGICPHWYVGGNIGVSHLFDKQTPNVGASVDENGPGWSADVGYQFTRIFGAELGYTQYHDSRENSGSFNIAKTEHYSVYLAATGQLPLYVNCDANISFLAKLGAAYSYANKIYNVAGLGIAKASGSGSPYAALGFLFKINCNTDFILQWSRAWGNHLTGSADLYSAGVQFGIY